MLADMEVIKPDKLYKGKSYSEWISDWFNWFLSADADNRNSGPVVFLRSRGLPNKLTGANTSDVPGTLGAPKDSLDASIEDQSYSPSFSGTYVNDPNVRIGGDRLRIYEDQAVLVPIIIAYWLRYETNSDWGSMQDFTGLTIEYGDNPPDPTQLTVKTGNNPKEPIIKQGKELLKYRFVTPIFTAVVPDVQYGRSIKDFLESPVAPGSYPAIVEGYFVMIKFNGEHPEGGYWVHSWASAPREVRGPYFSELLYQIDVSSREEPQGRVTGWRPSRNERILSKILEQKEQSGDLTDLESKQFSSYFMDIGGYSATKGKVTRNKRKPIV